MKRPDEINDAATHRVLESMRNADPPPGLEQRVLHALETHAASEMRTRPHRAYWRDWIGTLSANPVFAGRRGLAFGVVALAAVAVSGVIATPWVLRHTASPARTATAASPSPSSPSSGLLAHRELPLHRDASLQTSRQARSDARVPLATATPDDPLVTAARQNSAARQISASMIKRRGDMDTAQATPDPFVRSAAGFPAPPLPLTEQERLLLRIVHRGDREEIALLNPIVRNEQSSAEKAQFEEFFREPPPPPSLAPTTEPTKPATQEKP